MSALNHLLDGFLPLDADELDILNARMEARALARVAELDDRIKQLQLRASAITVQADYAAPAPKEPECSYCGEWIGWSDEDSRLSTRAGKVEWECAGCRFKHDEDEAAHARKELEEEDYHGCR
jgi:hypothetical protein